MAEAKDVDLLVVDDDDEFRDTMVRWFSRAGFRCEDVANADEALSSAQRREFDVAIFDMVMPGRSGLELLEEFKTSHVECEVILLTGQGTIETAVEAIVEGPGDVDRISTHERVADE